jgi:hypothetical protein
MSYKSADSIATDPAVAANTAKVSADGSVATHSDVTSAGSGVIMSGAERTKLTGIEDAADVTDTANVSAAGALMESGGTMTGPLGMGNQDVDNMKTGTFNGVVAQTLSVSSTLDFSSAQMIRLTVDTDAAVTVTPPPGPCTCTLWLVQSGGNNSILSWTVTGGAARFKNGTAVDAPQPAGEEDLVFLKYDGTNMYIGSDGPWS